MKCPTPETYVHLGKVVAGASFPQHSVKIQTNLEAVFKLIEDNLKNPYFLHKGIRPTRDGFGTDLPKGQRDESMLRNLSSLKILKMQPTRRLKTHNLFVKPYIASSKDDEEGD